MKKVYSKPVIIYDDFRLSANIAAGCEVITKIHDRGTCGYQDSFGIIFTDSTQGCDTDPPSGDKICYDVPFDYNNLFSS